MHPSTAPANIRPAVSAAALTGAAQPNAGYVLIVQDERGLVYIGHDENAVMKLERMRAGGLVINDRRVIRSDWTPHAREIALSLTQQFRAHRVEADAPWFAIPWADAVTAFEDWDTDRGQIRRTGDYLIGQQVQITADPRAVGEITAFRQEGHARKARVKFHKPGARIGGVCYIDAWCPIAELKPLVPAPKVAA